MPDLLVSPYTPALDSGRALRTHGVIRALSDVEVLYSRFGAAAPEFSGVPMRGVSTSRGLRRGALYARARLRGVPAGFARAMSPELRELALAHRADRVIADGPAVAAMLSERRPVVYLAHNVESSLERPGRWAMRRFERRLLAAAAESWMVSERDMNEAEKLCPAARLRLVPNVVDVGAIEPAEPSGKSILLFADYAYEPNREALELMVAEVMPLLWRSDADARLLIAGRNTPSLPGLDARIEALGYVQSPGEVYARVACAVVPLRSGSGSPLKFVEALAHGLPVVASTHAAAGLAVESGTHYLRADGAQQTAAALAGVLTGGAVELGRAGRLLAEQRYSVEALRELLAA